MPEKYSMGYGAASDAFARRTASVQAAFFVPFLKPTDSILDCGCGPGSITIGLAQLANQGKATGFDIEQSQVDRGRAAAKQQGVNNVEFLQASVYEIPFTDETFDAVYANATLEHLREPERALSEMRRVLRPGGVIGVRDIDYATYVLHPANEALTRFLELWGDLYQHNSGQAYIGRRLVSLLTATGFSETEASVSPSVRGTAEACRNYADAISGYVKDTAGPQFLELGWATSDDIERFVEGWQEWGAALGAYSSHDFFEVVAKKP